jgi:anti-sigma factor RsiW
MTKENARHTSSEMTCQELVELVTEYLEDTLAPSERVRFDAHLSTCLGCTAYIEQMRTTIRVLGKLSEESVSEAARRELLATFRTWKADVGKRDG